MMSKITVKKLVLFALIATAIPMLALAMVGNQSADENHAVIHTTSNGDLRFAVELAVTQDEMMKGLMHRAELKPQTGMLFVFNDVAQRSFWMKDTLIPLDLIFIAEDGRINHIHPMAQPLDETGIPSYGPAAAVLEINGGEAAALGLAPGDQVEHPSLTK